MLISVHIPKCAGTSFRHILQGLYEERLWLNYGTAFVRASARAEMIPVGTECIHGHFFADTFDDVVPERQLITWLRDPVERVVSNYYHFLRSPDLRDDCCRAVLERQLTLREFAELEWMRNLATRYFAGRQLDDFVFVGIAERFLESLHVFGSTIGWPAPLPVPRDNTNPARLTERYEISTRDYDFIRSLNALDFLTYERAVARLDREVIPRAPRAA
jgi:hypothetical protein